MTAQWSRGPPAAGREGRSKTSIMAPDMGREELGSSSSMLPPMPCAVPPGVACSSCSSFLAQRPQPHASPPALWLVPSCQQSAICLLLAEGLSLYLTLSCWREAWEQPPPDSQPRGLDQSSHSVAFPVQSHSGNAWGVALLPHCGPGVTSVRAESEKQSGPLGQLVWIPGFIVRDSCHA